MPQSYVRGIGLDSVFYVLPLRVSLRDIMRGGETHFLFNQPLHPKAIVVYFGDFVCYAQEISGDGRYMHKVLKQDDEFDALSDINELITTFGIMIAHILSKNASPATPAQLAMMTGWKELRQLLA